MNHPTLSMPKQSDFLDIPESPLSYWLSDALFSLFKETPLSNFAIIVQQIITANNSRFLRNHWEAITGVRWKSYVKGGGYGRWFGKETWLLDWNMSGLPIKLSILEKYPYLNGNWGWLIKTETFFKDGWTYTNIARGSLGVRKLDSKTICDSKSPTLILKLPVPGIGAVLNSHLITFLLRAITPSVDFRESYVLRLPIRSVLPTVLSINEGLCVLVKRHLVETEPTERSFFIVPKEQGPSEAIAALLHTLEGVNEQEVFTAYGAESDDIRAILEETGTPAGFHPLISNYETLPELPADLNLPALPQEVLDYLAAHERITPPPAELQRIKARLRALYDAGPGAKEDEEIQSDAAGSEDEGEGAVSGAHIPIPTETFLEELSVKMQLHPISIYWLLEELRREGVRCKPEERRMLEDRLSVLVLRLLGHRWPKQIEAGEPVPAWADRDGIILLASGPDGLAERVRARLREEDGDVGANRAESLLAELAGLSLEEWLRREFFKRHVRQFKYRPIAWQLASDPAAAAGGGKGKGRGSKRLPAFECLVYYHATAGDALARIRTQYVEPLLRIERQNMEAARRGKDETQAAQAQARVQELEEFTRRLREVEEQGFVCPELDKLLASEPLDRWSGDGVLAPAEQGDLLRQERAWRVDLNDGVRVNIAPLQLAGLLVSDVLKAADAKKAIADRARWRSDERRWVREGKLPRCGWMPDTVPESSAWTQLAPQREAERRKLEEKRKAVLSGREE